ncbi:hypothetical protein GW17_00060350 [Ensete ventricosum]|nr:hypothetical protein GW17_00060350 [Ensete ventricosum]
MQRTACCSCRFMQQKCQMVDDRDTRSGRRIVDDSPRIVDDSPRMEFVSIEDAGGGSGFGGDREVEAVFASAVLTGRRAGRDVTWLVTNL